MSTSSERHKQSMYLHVGVKLVDMGTDSHDFAHVGVTVPDIEEAIEWYVDVLGWTLLKGPRSSRGGEGFGGRRAVDLLGEYQEMKVAHLMTGNGIGIEFFEFDETDSSQEHNPKQAGFFHICVVDPDVEDLATRIDQHGGNHYAEVWRLYENDDEYLLTYCRDPFGNMIEIYSHPHEQMHAIETDTEESKTEHT